VGTPDRVAALSTQLIHVHQALREQLASVRLAAAGEADSSAGAALREDLLSHCVTFCTAIHTHHSGEDASLLPALRSAVPELAPVIDKLVEDHELVASIIRRIYELMDPEQVSFDPGRLLRELDGLTAILESHFSYEERRIAKALDVLGPRAWSAEVFDPGQASARA
jgi:Hemerythrin HHE cation binding domain